MYPPGGARIIMMQVIELRWFMHNSDRPRMALNAVQMAPEWLLNGSKGSLS